MCWSPARATKRSALNSALGVGQEGIGEQGWRQVWGRKVHAGAEGQWYLHGVGEGVMAHEQSVSKNNGMLFILSPQASKIFKWGLKAILPVLQNHFSFSCLFLSSKLQMRTKLPSWCWKRNSSRVEEGLMPRPEPAFCCSWAQDLN